jgi:hypothetical protein
MAEPIAQDEEQGEEQGEGSQFQPPANPQEPTEAEEAEEAGQGEEQEPEPEAAGPVGAVSEKELERGRKKIETAAATFARKVGEIMGEEANLLEPCPRCAPTGIPGFVFPIALAPVDPDTKRAVLVSVGEEASEVTEPSKWSRRCDACNGIGRVLTGSRDNRHKTKECYACNGRGWVPVGPEWAGVASGAPPVAASNGPGAPTEPAPDTDPWGRTPDDPNYGRMPQYVGVG